MNKNEKCLVCKFQGRPNKAASLSTIYQAGQNHYIHLCYSHSVEFFKIGQVKFMVKYRDDFKEYGFSENDSLFQNADGPGILTAFS